jgi:hypothetical protein
MSECILIAVVGAFINMVLALLIPCLLKNTKLPILTNIKQVYAAHRQSIIISSIIVFITIYLALKITPELNFSLNSTYETPVPRRVVTESNESLENLFNSMRTTHPNPSEFRIINLSKL